MNKTLKMKLLFVILVTICLLNFPEKSSADDADSIFLRAKDSMRKGQLDFAFSNLHFLTSLYPESKHYKPALFALGEYYYDIGDYYNASEKFNEILNIDPESEAKIFIKLYLIEIAKKRGRADRVNSLKKEIVAYEQLSLLFRDFKEYLYISALMKNYKAIYYIDKIEFFIDEKPFSTLFY